MKKKKNRNKYPFIQFYRKHPHTRTHARTHARTHSHIRKHHITMQCHNKYQSTTVTITFGGLTTNEHLKKKSLQRDSKTFATFVQLLKLGYYRYKV